MSSFLDKFIADTYNGILHSDIGLDETSISQIFDGDGNKSALSLGRENNGGKITGTLVSTSSTVEQDLSVGGDITADNVSSSSINTDSLIIKNSLQASNVNYPVSNNLTSIFALIYPIGSIYLTALNIYPGSIFTGTTWVRTSQGKFLVGVGAGTDSNAFGKTFTNGENGGEYRHTQTVEELASHKHDIFITRSSQGDDNAGAQPDVGTSFRNIAAVNANANGLITLDKGGNQPFNVTPPSFGVYVWQRTA
jgi:hypothetical protein